MQGLLPPRRQQKLHSSLLLHHQNTCFLSSRGLNTQGLSRSALDLYFEDGSLPSTISQYHLQSTFGCQNPYQTALSEVVLEQSQARKNICGLQSKSQMTWRLRGWVCIFPCLGHHLLGPSQIIHVGKPEYSRGQHHPFLNLRHGSSVTKRILWNNIRSPLPLGTVIPGFVQSSRVAWRRSIGAFQVSHSPLQGSLPEMFHRQLL